MKILISAILGYLLGTLSPAALLSKLKNKNLRENGTGNLGATNTMLVLGKGYGALVMLFDIAKAYFAYKIAELIFPTTALAGLVAGGASVIGHIFPFYMKFKGGKGLASFGGMVLAHNSLFFVLLLVLALAVMLVSNQSVAMPLTASIWFPIMCGIQSKNAAVFAITALIGVIMILKHTENIKEALRGDNTKIRAYIKENLLH